MSTARTSRLGLVFCAVAVTAFAARVAAALWLDGFFHPQLEEAAVIARNIVAGRGFTFSYLGIVYHSYQAPLPALLGAVSYWLTGSPASYMTLQILAGTLLSVIAAAIAHRLCGHWIAALAAGILVALHPGLVVYNASRFHPLSFDSLVFSLGLLQSFRLAEKPDTVRGAQMGAIVGIGLLSRPTMLVFLPVSAVWLVVVTSAAMRRAAIRSAIVATICAAVIIAPWTIRNYRLHDRFVFILTTDNELLWRGNNPHANGSSYLDKDHTVLSTLPADALFDLEHQPNEIAQSQWFRTRALAFMRSDPAAFARLLVRKFVIFWSWGSVTGVLYPRQWVQAYLTYYVLAVVLAALGVWQILRMHRQSVHLLVLVGAFMLTLSLLQTIYYVEGRHRWGIEAMLLAVSGVGVAALSRRRLLHDGGHEPARASTLGAH